MKTLFLFILVVLFFSCEALPSFDSSLNNNTFLLTEGKSKKVNIDSTTELKKLISNLNSSWTLRQTDKAYSIGYTELMYSIASRRNSVTSLLDFFYLRANSKGKIGVIYTLHLIGINSVITSVTSERFVDTSARKALLKLLDQDDVQPLIMSLLIRDPWSFDLPELFHLIQNSSNECWAIINGLARYQIPNFPIHQPIPLYIGRYSIEVEKNILKEKSEDEIIKYCLNKIRIMDIRKVKIDSQLFSKNLFDVYSNGYFAVSDPSINIEINICDLLTMYTSSSFTSIGSKFQYFVEDDNLYICTPLQAKKRISKWWLMKSENERISIYNMKIKRFL